MPTISQLGLQIEPFHVMEVLKRAEGLAQSGEDIIHLSIGEPDFPIPTAVKSAFLTALESNLTRYTAALGIQPLREKLAEHYHLQFGVQVKAEQIVVTSGSSAALQYACLALFNPGDEVLIADPSYPCNKAFIQTSGAVPVSVDTQPEQGFQPTPQAIHTAWGEQTRGVLLASPANPTGRQIQAEALKGIADWVQQKQGVLIVDEIYQMLSYLHQPVSVLQQLGAPCLNNGLVVVNSFSKYFGLTGLRLGWMVVPEEWVKPIEKLAQNLAICPSAPAQHAALACFEEATLMECEARKTQFAQRRNFLVKTLTQVGLPFQVEPDSAFYFYLPSPYDSGQYCLDMLEQTGVCTVPGHDFSARHGHQMLRLSYANSMTNLEKAMDRISRWHRMT